MKIALNRSTDRFCGNVEEAWAILPHGLRDLIIRDVFDIHDLHEVFTTFTPLCKHLIEVDNAYDWNMPRSIDAAFVIAGDLYLGGNFHQSCKMIFFASILREIISDCQEIFYVAKIVRSSKISEILNLDSYTSRLVHIHHVAANTRTTKLLGDFLSEVYPRSEKIWRRKLSGSAFPTADSLPLFNSSVQVLKRKLITLFCDFGSDNYREVQVYEDSTLLGLFKVWTLYLLDTDIQSDVSLTMRTNLILPPLERLIKFKRFVRVNDAAEYHLFTSADRSLKELGIKEGDTIACQFKEYNGGASELGDSEPVSHKSNERTSRNVTKQRHSKKKRKPKTSSNRSPAYQQPSNQHVKEAHSKKMERVLHELRPQLQPIRRKLDSLTLQRQLPKQKGMAISRNDQENIDNFTNSLTTSGTKAGKTVYLILVGLESNLYSSSKVSRERKAISLDLHGLTKKGALSTLKENLPRWVDTAMKGEHPWVIPVNVICGGGSQELSEVVAAWIRREKQVANRPKSFM